MIKKWHIQSIEKTVWPKKWGTVDEYTFERQDGKQTKWYIHPGPGVVIIFARTTKGEVICIKQYRQGIDMIDIGFPAGGVKKGVTPLQSAKEELEEEAGYRSKKWQCIDKRARSAGGSTSWQYTYLAEECYEVGQKLEDDEFIEVELCSVAEVQSHITSKKMKDMGCAFAGLVALDYITK